MKIQKENIENEKPHNPYDKVLKDIFDSIVEPFAI